MRVKFLLRAGLFTFLISILLSCASPGARQVSKNSEAPPSNPAEQSGLTSEPLSEETHPLAFNYLPKAKQGYPDWVQALEQGVIHPKDTLTGDPDIPTMPALDFNIVFKAKGDIPDVVYPHKPHTEWLDCRNCHPGIFKMQAGSNPVTMEKIVQGEFCGRCHGKVSFPLSDCSRCHSKPKS